MDHLRGVLGALLIACILQSATFRYRGRSPPAHGYWGPDGLVFFLLVKERAVVDLETTGGGGRVGASLAYFFITVLIQQRPCKTGEQERKRSKG